MTTTAKISSKGTNGTGITEDLASTLHNNLGRKVLAVVELVAEARSEKRNGDESVTLSILTVEPAPNTATENHLRELARSFHYERQLADGQLQIETGDDLEPKVADVLAAGAGHLPHPYLASGLSIDEGACDVCGLLEDAPVHHMDEADELDDEADEPLPEPDDEHDDEPDDEPDDGEDDNQEPPTADTDTAAPSTRPFSVVP